MKKGPFIPLKVNEISMPSSGFSNFWCQSLRELYWFHSVNTFQNSTARFEGLRIWMKKKIRSLKFKLKSLFYLSLSSVTSVHIFLVSVYSPHSIHPLTDIKETRKGHRSIKYSWPRFIDNLLCIHYVFENSSICGWVFVCSIQWELQCSSSNITYYTCSFSRCRYSVQPT